LDKGYVASSPMLHKKIEGNFDESMDIDGS
jgi:hypothetical protein